MASKRLGLQISNTQVDKARQHTKAIKRRALAIKVTNSSSSTGAATAMLTSNSRLSKGPVVLIRSTTEQAIMFHRVFEVKNLSEHLNDSSFQTIATK